MTPDRLARPGTEDAHQKAFFCWIAMARMYGFQAADDELCYTKPGHAKGRYFEEEGAKGLDLIFAIPNGGKRDRATAALLKATGTRAGYPDIALDYPCHGFHGLRIELKRPGTDSKRKGQLGAKQREWLEKLNAVGYKAVTAMGWKEARDEVLDYFHKGEHHVRDHSSA